LKRFSVPHEVYYLPQYHPELNPIEEAWSQVKSTASYGPTYNLTKMKDEVLPQCLKVVSPERAMKLFRHAAKVKAELLKKYVIVENIIHRASL